MKELEIKDCYVMPVGKGFMSIYDGQVHLDDLNNCIFNRDKAKSMLKTYGLPVYKLTLQLADDLEFKEDKPIVKGLPYQRMQLVRDGQSVVLDQWNGSPELVKKYHLKPTSKYIPIFNQRWTVPNSDTKTIEIGDWITFGALGNNIYVYTKSDIKRLREAGWENATDGIE